MKRCSKCKKTKAKGEFHRDRSKKDGLQHHCKECRVKYTKSPHAKAARKRYRQSDAGKVTHKRYRQSKKGKATRQRYLQSDFGKMSHNQAAKRQREIRPNQTKATHAVNNAVAAGRMPHISTQTCHCGDQAKHYHHHSYEPEFWLDVEAVCMECHVKAHARSP